MDKLTTPTVPPNTPDGPKPDTFYLEETLNFLQETGITLINAIKGAFFLIWDFLSHPMTIFVLGLFLLSFAHALTTPTEPPQSPE